MNSNVSVNGVVDAMKVVTDYTTSVRSLAYSNIDQANMHQFPIRSKIVITYNTCNITNNDIITSNTNCQQLVEVVLHQRLVVSLLTVTTLVGIVIIRYNINNYIAIRQCALVHC